MGWWWPDSGPPHLHNEALHFQVLAGVFDCQQILIKISFVIFDIVVEKKYKSNVVYRGTGEIPLIWD